DESLPRPEPGAPRPQEQATSQQAKEALFGNEETQQNGTAAASLQNTKMNEEVSNGIQGAAPDAGESAFLAKAGAQNADPSIRRKVDAETETLNKKNVPVAKKLLGLGGDPNAAPVSVVNAKEEAERLKQNQAQGKPVTAGKTPTIEK